VIIALVSVAVDVEVSVNCEIACKAYNRRLRVRLEVVIVGGIAAEVGIESKVICIGFPSSLVTRGL
jgi:hypothetical protein